MEISIYNNDVISNDNIKECICLSTILEKNVTYCKLVCGCEVHAECLTSYIKNRLEDKASIKYDLIKYKKIVPQFPSKQTNESDNEPNGNNADVNSSNVANVENAIETTVATDDVTNVAANAENIVAGGGANNDNVVGYGFGIPSIPSTRFTTPIVSRAPSPTPEPSSSSLALLCPYFNAKLCKSGNTPNDEDIKDICFITLTDLETLANFEDDAIISNAAYVNDDDDDANFISNLGNSFFQGNDNDNDNDNDGFSNDKVNEKEIEKLGRWLKEFLNPELYDTENIDRFINASTKACPKCNFRVSHYMGHACHHITCQNCNVGFCYKCEQSGEMNSKERGGSSNCKCGGWSNNCNSFDSNSIKCIVVNPYPRDSRCGISSSSSLYNYHNNIII